MSEQTYEVTRKQIIKAANMTHARHLSEGYNDFPGEVLIDTIVSKTSDKKNSWRSEVSVEENDSTDVVGLSNTDFLRTENRRLAKLSEKYKNVKEETVTAVLSSSI